MEIPAASLARIRELYGQGRYTQALQAAAEFGPLRTWSNTAARLLAGRLAMQLGAPRLGRRLHLVAYRSSPAHLEAVYYHARFRFERCGPYSCWEFIRQHDDWNDASPELRADWLALSGFVLSRLNDFDRAERLIQQAEQLAPNRPWIQVERAAILEASDRLDEAIEAAQHSLELQPWFRPGVQSLAHLLLRRGKQQETVELLTSACESLESGIVCAHLASVLIDQADYTTARQYLDRYEKLSPLLDSEGAKWLHARRADVAYHCGDFLTAAEEAQKVGEDFYTAFAERLRQHADDPRPGMIQLQVESAGDSSSGNSIYEMLARYWKTPLPAVPIDAVPTYDGLPDAIERRRAEISGWKAREFTVTSKACCDLIGAGIPFLITLVEVGVSQTRLVLGHDPIRESLIVADGQERQSLEAPLQSLLTRYQSSGPRGLALLPPGSDKTLPDLPDSALYDDLFRIQCAIQDASFRESRSLIQSMKSRYPNHRLTRLAELAWARATSHPVLLLEAADALLADRPDDPTFSLTKAAALRELGRADERQTVLERVGSTFQADPLLMQSLAQCLMTNPLGQDSVDRLLRRSIRMRPHAAAGYYLLASQRWEQQRFSEAVDLYRFAWCLDDREDSFADAYSRVARTVNQAPEALRLFQRRAHRSSLPHLPALRALFAALVDRDEIEQAFVAIDKAVERLSGPGVVEPMRACAETSAENSESAACRSLLAELQLFRAEMRAHYNRFEEAEEDLASVRPFANIAYWHKSAARIARIKPDLTQTLQHLQAVLKIEPLWYEGHRQVAGLLLETQGRVAARQYVQELVQQYPYLYPVQRIRAEILSTEADDTPLSAIRSLLELCPRDAWAHRQLALVLADRKRDPEALEHVRLAGEIEPDHPSHFAVLAHVHKRAERIDSALEAYRTAVKSDVDHDLAVSELIVLSRGRKEKVRAARFIAEQLMRQPHSGDGLLAYRDQVFQMAADEERPEIFEELHSELERILDQRPDLWQAWSLLIQQLGLMHRLDEAKSLAQEATERFPLLAQLWTDLSRVSAARDENDERIEALRHAVAAAPAWPPAAHELADALTEADEHQEAIAVLERITARVPLDATTHALLAEHLWSADRSAEALSCAKRAVRLDPGFDPAWKMVLQWSDRLDQPDEAIELCRQLTQSRPGDVRCWLKLARLLYEPSQAAEALKALDTAIQLDPKSVEAHDLKAERLAELGKFEEALQAARPAELATELPLILQGRAAWVEAKRGNYAAAIPPMQALVSVEPEYFWGWQQLAEWYNETGRNAGYLEASSELCRLKPEHPLPLTMRGEAKLKTGDREGGKSDLRDALRLAPQYAPAAAILFDSCLHDGEFRDARAALAVLQEHAGGLEVLVKQIQLACKTSDVDGAMLTLTELVSTPGDAPPVILQVVLNDLEAAGWSDRATVILREAWQSGEPFHPWAPIYWLDTDEGEAADFDEKIAAVDAVIRHYPTSYAGYDRKAELLSQVGRHDEALSTCRSPAVGDPPPVILRGRAAWVEARRGNRTKAIQLMKQAVSDDPGYLWGWRNLAQWYDAEGRHKECLEAAEQMVRLSGEDPLAYGYRGEARRLIGDHTGARHDFERAFDLDPTFDAAGLHLIAEQLAADEIDAAVKTLARLEEHSQGPMVRLRGVQVAVRQDNLNEALSRFRALATDPDASKGLLQEAVNSFEKQGWASEADMELATIMAGKDSTPATAAIWCERLCAKEQGWKVQDSLASLYTRNALAAREATVAYARAMAAAGRPDAAATTIHRYAESLRMNVESWAKAGAALAEAKSFALAASWLADWQNRDGLEAWMLCPLADALRAQDRDAEAKIVARKGLELGGPARIRSDFASWLALDAAVEGRSDEAADILKTIDQIGLPDGIKLVLAMAEAVVMVSRAGPDGRAAAFRDARDHLRSAAGACRSDDVPPGAGRWYRKVVARICKDTGTMLSQIWASWQQLFPNIRG